MSKDILKLKPDEDGDTILHFAAADNNIEILANYVKSGVNIDVQNHLGWTPLMVAVKKGYLKTTKFLLRLGASPTKRNGYGVCSLSIAVSCGNLEILQFLLQNNKNIHKNNYCSITPLVVATLCNNIEIIKFLLSQSFRIDCKTELGGLTPILIAAMTDNKDAMKVFKRYSRLSCVGESIIPMYREVPRIVFNQKVVIQAFSRLSSNSGTIYCGPKDVSPNVPRRRQILSCHNNASISVWQSSTIPGSVKPEENYIDDVFENISLTETDVENIYEAKKPGQEAVLVQDLPKIPELTFSVSPNKRKSSVNEEPEKDTNDWPKCSINNPHRCRSSTQSFPKNREKYRDFANISAIKPPTEEGHEPILPKLIEYSNFYHLKVQPKGSKQKTHK